MVPGVWSVTNDERAALDRAPSMTHAPVRTCSSRHAEHTSICRAPGTVQTAVMGAGVRATQRFVWTEHAPVMTTPVGSTFMSFSFTAVALLSEFKPLDQSVPGIFHEVLAVLPPQDRVERRMDARLRLVEQHVRQDLRALIPEAMPLGVSVLVRQAGQQREPRVRADRRLVRQGIRAEVHHPVGLAVRRERVICRVTRYVGRNGQTA